SAARRRGFRAPSPQRRSRVPGTRPGRRRGKGELLRRNRVTAAEARRPPLLKPLAQAGGACSNANRVIRNTALYACLAPVALAPAIAAAQPYPSRPVRALVGFPPGGATDILARQIGQKLSESFGQQVIVDNPAGARGLIP